MTNAPTWATQISNIPCAVWPVGASVVSPFYRPEFKGTHIIAAGSDLGALPGDRMTLSGQGGVYYLVEGFELYSNAAISGETIYLLDVTRKVTS